MISYRDGKAVAAICKIEITDKFPSRGGLAINASLPRPPIYCYSKKEKEGIINKLEQDGLKYKTIKTKSEDIEITDKVKYKSRAEILKHVEGKGAPAQVELTAEIEQLKAQVKELSNKMLDVNTVDNIKKER